MRTDGGRRLRAQITLRNGCLPATPSALMDMCLEQSIDADVDLLFIEYVANDGANRCAARRGRSRGPAAGAAAAEAAAAGARRRARACCGRRRFDETKAKVYERLLRKTLQQAHKPAVVLMQVRCSVARQPAVTLRGSPQPRLAHSWHAHHHTHTHPWPACRHGCS